MPDITIQQYRPSEIIAIFNELLARQNTQAAKDLNAAKDRARELERQLEAAKNSNGGNSSTLLYVILTAIATLTISYFLFGMN